MKPYPGQHAQGSKQSETYVQNVFGIMSAIFRVLTKKTYSARTTKSTNNNINLLLLA